MPDVLISRLNGYKSGNMTHCGHGLGQYVEPATFVDVGEGLYTVWGFVVFSHWGKSRTVAYASGRKVIILPHFGVLAPRFLLIHTQ